MNELKLIEIFCKSDDFCQKLEKFAPHRALPGSVPFSHKVFDGIAARGKTKTDLMRSVVDWFYGFKLHLTINTKGELLGFALSAGNMNDRNRAIVQQLTRFVKGILVGDKGYISKDLAQQLAKQGIHLLTKIKSNVKNALVDPLHKLFLKKRALIESIIDRIKETTSIEHTRHRSQVNFLANTFAALTAYSFMEDKPHLHFSKPEFALLH